MAATKKRAKAPQKREKDRGSITIVGRTPPTPVEEDHFLDDKMIKLSDYLYETKIKTSTVRDNLKRFLTEIGDLVADAPQLFGAYELHEIEISAELSISGELKLLGFGGADVEGKGGLKFLIRRTAGNSPRK
jgi:hypothetical protein